MAWYRRRKLDGFCNWRCKHQSMQKWAVHQKLCCQLFFEWRAVQCAQMGAGDCMKFAELYRHPLARSIENVGGACSIYKRGCQNGTRQVILWCTYTKRGYTMTSKLLDERDSTLVIKYAKYKPVSIKKSVTQVTYVMGITRGTSSCRSVDKASFDETTIVHASAPIKQSEIPKRVEVELK